MVQRISRFLTDEQPAPPVGAVPPQRTGGVQRISSFITEEAPPSPAPPALGMGDLRAAEARPLVPGGELRAGRPSSGELVMSAFKKAPLVETIVNLFHPPEKIALPREPEELPVQPQGAKEWLAYGLGAALGEAPSIAASYATGGAGAAGLLGRLAPKAPALAELAARGAGAGLVHGTFRAAAQKQPLPEALKTAGTEAATFAIGDPALSAAGSMVARAAAEAFRRFKAPPAPAVPARPVLAPPPERPRVFRPAPAGPKPEAPALAPEYKPQPLPGVKLPEASAEEIQQARSGLKEMDDALRVRQTDEGPVMLYSGIPADKVADSVRAAGEKLADNLGVPAERVTIVQPEAARQPGLLTPFKSPTRVALKYPQVKPYVDDGIKAVETQERLRSLFNKRLAAVDTHLGEPRLKDPLGRQYQENKGLLYEILLTEDALGKRLSPVELKKHFGANEKVIKAHSLIRSAFDHAYAIANRTRELRGKAPVSYREGYVPHFFHDWLIVVNGQVAGSARTLREAVKAANPLARQGAQIKIVPKQFDFPGADLQAAVIGDMSYFRMKAKVAQDFGMSHADAAALLDGVVRMRGRSRFVGNFLQRKGVPGWERNLDWVNRHYFNMISRYAALDGFKAKSVTRFEREFGAFDKEHKGVAKYVKNYINDVNGVPTDVENLLNNTLEKVPVIRQFLGAYLGDRPSLHLAGATTNAVAIAKLGLYNVSSALINATQLLNTYAALGAEWTSKGLLKALRLNVKDKAILKRLGVDLQLGLESGAGYSKAAQMGQLFSKSTALFQATEKLMRRTAGLGAFYKAMTEGRPAQEALDFAKEAIRKTQFEYSVADAPAFIRRTGPVGQVLFQFKKFPVKELEFITQLKGAENARFWIPFALLSGYYAFPLAEPLINTVKAMFGIDLELELKRHLMGWAGSDQEKQAAAKAIMYGAFGSLGVDVSRRIGAGDFIPSSARDLPGPALSTVVNAAQLAAKGNWIETLRAISPAPGNLLLALQIDGELSNPWERERLKAQLAPWERAFKAAGFMPAQESVQRDIKRVVSYEEARRREAETAAIDEYIKSLSGPPEKTQTAVNRLIELQISPDRVKAEMQKKMMLPAERAAENVPRKRQAEYQNILEFGR